MGTGETVLTHHEWVSSQLRPFAARGSIADFLDQRVFHSGHEEPEQNLSHAVFRLFLSHLPQSHWQALCQRMKRPDAEDEEALQEGLARHSWRVVRAVVQLTHRLLIPAAEALLEAEESARSLVTKRRARRRAVGGRPGEEDEEHDHLLWISHMRRRYKYLSRELGERRGQEEQSGFGPTEESLSRSLWASTPISSEMVHRLYLGLSVLARQPPDPEDPDRQEWWSQISSVALKCLGYVGDALADEMVVETGSLGVEDMVGTLIQKMLAVVVRCWEGCNREGEGRASLRILKGIASEVSHLVAASQLEAAAVTQHTLQNRVPVQATLRHPGSPIGPTSPRDPTSPNDPGSPRDPTSPRDPGSVGVPGRIFSPRPDSSSDASPLHRGGQEEESDEEDREEEEEEGTEEESDGEDEESETVGEEITWESHEDQSDEEVCDEQSAGESHEDQSDEEDYLDEDGDSEDVVSRGQDECCDREQEERMRAGMGHLGTRVPLSKHITPPFPPPIVLPRSRLSSRKVESSVPRRTILNRPLGLEEEQVFTDHDPRPSASISPREVMNDLSSSRFRHECLQVLKDLLCITLASSFPESLALGQGSMGRPPLRGDPSLHGSSLDSIAAEILRSLGASVANMFQTNVTGCALIPRLRMSEMDLAAAGQEVHSTVRQKLTDFLSGCREASERKRQAKRERAETFLVDLLSDLRVSDLEEGGPAHALVGELLNNMGYPADKYRPPPGRGGRDRRPAPEEDRVRALHRCSGVFFSCHDLEPLDLPASKETVQEGRGDKPGRIRTMEDVVSAMLADVEPDEELLAGAPAAEVRLARLEGWIGRGRLGSRLPTLIRELSALLYEQTTPRRPWDSEILDPSEQIYSFAMEAVNQLIPGAFPLSPPPPRGVDRHRCGSSYFQQSLYQMPPGGAGGGLAEPEDHGEVVDLYVNLILGQVMENLKLSAAVSRNVLQVEKLDMRDFLHPRRLTVRGRLLRSFRRISRWMRSVRSKESREIRGRRRVVEGSEEEPCLPSTSSPPHHPSRTHRGLDRQE